MTRNPACLPTPSADGLADLTRHDKEERGPEFPREMRTRCEPTECPRRDREPAAITNPQVDGRRAGIRTQERVAPLAVFKTVNGHLRGQGRRDARGLDETFYVEERLLPLKQTVATISRLHATTTTPR